MEKTISTFYFGNLTLTADEFNEGHVEATDNAGRVIAEIYGYDLNEITEEVIEANLA